jgi:hypothetical protein
LITDAEIAGYMGWRGPGAYTAHKLRKIRQIIAEAEKRTKEDTLKNEFICAKCGLRKDSEHITEHEF